MIRDIKNFFKALYVLIIRVFILLGDFLVKLITFLGPVGNSVKNVINVEEFYRVIVLSLSASGGLYGSLEYITTHAKEFIIDSNVIIGINAFNQHIKDKNIIISIFIVFFVLDYIRRKYGHGK